MSWDSTLFINYGVLGLWTAYLLYEKSKLFSKVVEALDNLAEVIGKHGRNHP